MSGVVEEEKIREFDISQVQTESRSRKNQTPLQEHVAAADCTVAEFRNIP